jgi:ATP-dependent DNA helicase Q5
MIDYCEGVSCRHAVFSKYFGDQPPKCDYQCDVCTDLKKVEKKVLEFSSHQLRGAAFRSTAVTITSESYDGLYEGGRRGTKRGFEDYGKASCLLHCFTVLI